MPTVWADECLIEQVYANLIGNALKYTGQESAPRIEIGFDREASDPHYFVKDNGIGFDMRHAERLFVVFERLHQDGDYEGSGVGLATVKRILERHGGRIWAEGEPGRGATFRFVLP